jgi:hypothetical protein
MTDGQALARVSNPFGASLMEAGGDPSLLPAAGGATSATDQARAVAEVQAAMVVARTHPRDERRAMDRILIACQRPGLAAEAIYSYARGGTAIEGPSIRLAEAMALAWGNVASGWRELSARGGVSQLQAYAWDLETNVRHEMTFEVPHIRWSGGKATVLRDPRDIYEACANNASRRVRACILKVIPADVTDAAVAQASATMKAGVDVTPDAIAAMVEAFAAFGVKREAIETRIQRRLDAITPANVLALRKIFTSLKDGMSSPADWFDVADTQGPLVGEAAAAPSTISAEFPADERKTRKGKKAEPVAPEPPEQDARPTHAADDDPAAEEPADTDDSPWNSDDQTSALEQISAATDPAHLDRMQAFVTAAREARRLNMAMDLEEAIESRRRALRKEVSR